MLNAAEDGEGDEPSFLRWRPLQVRVGVGYGMSCLGRTCAIVECHELTRDSSNVIFAQEDEVMQSVLAKSSVEALDVGICVWRPKRSRYSLDFQHLLKPEVEVTAIAFSFRTLLWMPKLPENSVVVVQEKTRRAIEC